MTNLKRICLYLLWSLIFVGTGLAHDFELPVYAIEIDSSYLDDLYAHPTAKVYFPAIFKYKNEAYKCSVRFRGRTSLNLPQKSWKIKIEEKNHPFNSDVLNLNAEYRDKSKMRNGLAFKLFKVMGQPAPHSEFVNFLVNGKYMGVYHNVEQVDEFFLERHNKERGDMFKAVNHGANLGLLLNYDKYPETYEKKIGDGSDYTLLQKFNSKLYFYNNNDVTQAIDNLIEINNFLTFFAIEFVIVDEDGVTKNFYLYFNTLTNKFEIFPWDNDASYGNNWRGEYVGNYEVETFYTLRYQLLFQRLMEVNEFKQSFFSIIDEIINTGFNSLHSIIDSTYQLIKHDVYLDSSKICTNYEFDAEIDSLKTFLNKRKQFLTNFDYFQKVLLTDYYCSNSYPETEDETVTFRVQAQQIPLKIYFGFLSPDDKTEKYIQMYDDGQHDDYAANDLIYGIQFSLSGYHGLVPYFFRSYFKSSQFSYFPQNACFYYCYNPCFSYALNITPYAPTASKISFGKVRKINTDPEIFIISIQNLSANSVDLSLCTINYKNYFYHFPIPAGIIIAPGDSLWGANKKELINNLFPEIDIIGNLFCNIELGDTIKLFSPGRQIITSHIYNNYDELIIPLKQVVINEINYNSAEDFDSDDWVELYNHTGPALDLTNWKFKDEDDDHYFSFPQHTVLPSNSYLVLCKDTAAFKSHFPDVTNYTGNLDFGFSGKGELLRLFNELNFLIDFVPYDDKSPWPTIADGTGSTLQLLSPDIDNALPHNWYAATGHGSPGEKNDSCNISSKIVINEINYNSSTDYDCEDWIEFYNNTTSQVDMTNWRLVNIQVGMNYIFPENTIIDSRGYVVVCKNNTKFHICFPNLTNFIGNFNFDLNKNSDIIKLYNQLNILVDSVHYFSKPPWPSEANGGGTTLELLNPDYNNALVINWASSKKHGTPSEQNSGYIETHKNPPDRIPDYFQVFQNYPNPFNSTTLIKYELSKNSKVIISIFNVLGQQVDKFYLPSVQAGFQQFTWNGSNYGSGIYFYRIEAQNVVKIKKMILLR